jgi:23S rRNA (cytosine1962-C5)-methyltransferase
MKNLPKTKKVKIHPASLKHIKKGHPWVTADTYTKEFPNGEDFLQVEAGETKLLLLSDPNHPKIKARVWAFGDGRDLRANFPRELKERLAAAFNQRKAMNISENRENFYICFGEADLLPGLFIQALGSHVLVQVTCNFWVLHKKRLADMIRLLWEEHFPDKKYLNGWWCDRGPNALSRITSLRLATSPPKELIIEEFGVKYLLKPMNAHDPGIYTDMSAIREDLFPILESSKRVLNLYAYTGAYSLIALKKGASEVHSVDLSQNYIDWLETNLKENTDIDASKHTSHCMPVEEALKKFKAEGKKFDLIICDPPSASSDGKKMGKATDSYPRDLPLMNSLLDEGGKIVAFVNTHTLSWKKFNSNFDDIIKKKNLKLKSLEILKLKKDCPLKGGFQEGDYLKGRIFERFE